MKLVTSIFFIIYVSACFGQSELETEYGLENGSISHENYQFINSLEEKPEGFDKFEYIVELLESDSTENIIRVYLLEKYLSSGYPHDANFTHWLVNNLDYEIDRNAYTFQAGMDKDKYPILYYLLDLNDSNIFNEVDLLKSSFLANCELFEDAYTKLYTCKMMAEYLIKSGKHKSELFDIAMQEECSKKNFEQIMKFCF